MMSKDKQTFFHKLYSMVDACPYISSQEATDLKRAIIDVFHPETKTTPIKEATQ